MSNMPLVDLKEKRVKIVENIDEEIRMLMNLTILARNNNIRLDDNSSFRDSFFRKINKIL